MENDSRANHCVEARSATTAASDLYNPRAFSFGELRRMAICHIRNGREIHVLTQSDNGVHELIFDFHGLDMSAQQIRTCSIRYAAVMDHSDGFFFQAPQE